MPHISSPLPPFSMNAQSCSAINIEKGEGVILWVGVTILLAEIVGRELNVIADRSRD